MIWALLPKRHPKVFINDSVYKVFYQLCRMLQTVVLLMGFDVLRSRKTGSSFTENLMLFGTFRCPFAKRAPKASRNDRFYMVFPSTLPDASKRCFTNGFLMFCKVAKRHQVLLKTQCFLYFLMPFCEKGPRSIKELQVL